MGNKLKLKKISNQEEDSNSQNCYLLCPKCRNKIPYLNTFIDGDKIKIKILCECLDNNNYYILDLTEYISSISNNNSSPNQCINHPDTEAKKFCMNCESWLCIICFSKHTKDACNSEEIESNNDNEKMICFIHKNKKIYFCKQCRQIFCKICFLKHNVKNKKEHKAINIKNYLTERKIKSKMDKFEKYKSEIINEYISIKNDLLKNLTLEKNNEEKEENKDAIENEDKIKYKNLVEEIFLAHNKINAQLKDLIEIIFRNIEFFGDSEILNIKYICNVIMNTSINLNYPNLDKNSTIIEQVNRFINFSNNNFITKKLNSKLSFVTSYNKSNSIIEMMLSLPENKFVSINKDCAIQIWDSSTKKNIYTLHEHSNNITSIILLKNKKYFATASDDSTIKIWDYSKGICIKTIITEGKPFLIYEIFGKENQIGCVPYRNSLAIYEYNELKHNKIVNISLEKYIPWIEGLYQFPSDGRIILSTTGYFEVYSKEINKIKKIYIANDTPRIFLQLKNEDLAVGFLSKDIFIYDKNLMYKSRLCGHKKNITSVLQYDENKILTSSLDTQIFLWRMDDYEMIASFIHNNYGINAMTVINKNSIITSSFYKNSSIDEWNLEIFDNIN